MSACISCYPTTNKPSRFKGNPEAFRAAPGPPDFRPGLEGGPGEGLADETAHPLPSLGNSGPLMARTRGSGEAMGAGWRLGFETVFGAIRVTWEEGTW